MCPTWNTLDKDENFSSISSGASNPENKASEHLSEVNSSWIILFKNKIHLTQYSEVRIRNLKHKNTQLIFELRPQGDWYCVTQSPHPKSSGWSSWQVQAPGLQRLGVASLHLDRHSYPLRHRSPSRSWRQKPDCLCGQSQILKSTILHPRSHKHKSDTRVKLTHCRQHCLSKRKFAASYLAAEAWLNKFLIRLSNVMLLSQKKEWKSSLCTHMETYVAKKER